MFINYPNIRLADYHKRLKTGYYAEMTMFQFPQVGMMGRRLRAESSQVCVFG